MMLNTIKEVLVESDRRREANRTRLDKIEESTTSEGIKGLLAVNGGGAVAMLGFMQALLNKPIVFADFKYFGANALLFFCAGIFFTVLIPCARLTQIHLERGESDYAVYAAHLQSSFWIIGLVGFLGGAAFAGVGIDLALK